MALTPQGTITGFVSIEKPSDKYDTYSCKLIFTGKDAKKMKKDIDDLMVQSLALKPDGGQGRPPYIVDKKKLIVNFKQKATGKSKDGKEYTFTVKLFDTKGIEVTEELQAGEGTVCRISYKPYMWSVPVQGGASITLQLQRVQIIKLVKYETDGGGDDKFDAVEGSYEATTKNTNPFDEDDEDEIYIPSFKDDEDGDLEEDEDSAGDF
jgi:hypothetical protein